MKTRVSEMLGVKYPIILGGMVHVGKARLAAAVSNAGGVGTIAAGGLTREELIEEIEATRKLTDLPFAVNIPMLAQNAALLVDVVLESAVPIVIFSAGKPDPYVGVLKKKDIRVLQVVPNVNIAVKAEQAGVDAIIAEGTEAGGHIGRDEITTMVLIPQVADAVSVPVIAAGGIADARGVMAAFSLGAEGVQVGTRFAASSEAPVSDRFLDVVIDAADNSTEVIGRGFSPARVIKNSFSRNVLEMQEKGLTPPEILQFIGEGRSKRALVDGDLEGGSIMAGQVAGMINEIASVHDIISEFVRQSGDLLQKLTGFLEKNV